MKRLFIALLLCILLAAFCGAQEKKDKPTVAPDDKLLVLLERDMAVLQAQIAQLPAQFQAQLQTQIGELQKQLQAKSEQLQKLIDKMKAAGCDPDLQTGECKTTDKKAEPEKK